jgi:molybdopterin-guanine dinucleotide biosynthesis protein A
MRIAAVVLAGGEGRRISGGKPHRRLGGRTLLERALERARALSPDVALAVREPGQAGGAEVEVLTDAPGIEGPLAGLASALAFARARGAQAVLTLPCDAPFLPDDLAGRLSQALQADASCAVPQSGGRLHPTCALWRAELGPALQAYAASGRRALIGFAETVGLVAVPWPDEPVDPFFNINTPEDLERAEALLRPPPRPGSGPGG